LGVAVAGDPRPLTYGRLLLALDEVINPKTDSKLFASQRNVDHAVKPNESRFPWAQTLVTVGLPKVVHGHVDERDDDPLDAPSHDGSAFVAAGGLGVPKGGRSPAGWRIRACSTGDNSVGALGRQRADSALS
jgi:hypothetical protein